MADSHCDHCAELADHYRQELGRAEAELVTLKSVLQNELEDSADFLAELGRLRGGIRELLAEYTVSKEGRGFLERLLEKPDA